MRPLLLAALAAVSLATLARAESPEIGTFGLDTAGMDRSIRPADDFFGHMNGTWDRTTQIPADRSGYGLFAMLEERSTERTRDLLEAAMADADSRAGNAYRSYLDQERVEALGLAPIQPWLEKLRGLTRATYPALIAQAQQAGIATPFPNGVGQDDKAPETYILTFYQGGIGLPDRDYYLSDSEKMQEVRQAYLKHLATMLALVEEADADRRAKAILDFETRIARGHWTRVDSRDAEKIYNKLSVAELVSAVPGFDVMPVLAAGTPVSDVLVSQPGALTATAQAIAAAPVEVLRDQMIVRSLEAYAEYLPAAIAEANFAFYGTVLSGTPQRRDLWKRAVSFASAVVPDDVGRIYVAKWFPPETKAEMDRLVTNVMAAMGRRIDALDWMSAATKARAHEKLKSFTPKIGYPDQWRDFSALQVKPDDLFGNAWRSNLFDFAYERGKLGTPLRRWEWFMTPMTVNAYANFSMNEIVFPAAILQAPFFDPHADPAVNYGGIGAVIGHEISHHFDDQGSKYDAEGRLSTWWTEEDRARFDALTEKLVRQYDAYEALPGQFVNGKLTLGENIGDLAGVAVAYDAYRASLGGKPAPVLEGLNGDQRFFLGWAQVWRTKYREEAQRQRLLTDPHAPPRYRADIVRNFDEWYAAFKPGEGKLVLKPEERVKIW